MAIFGASILLSAPFMDAYSYATQLRINEVELNPVGPISGNQWIEIYNPTNVLIDISGYLVKGSKLGRTVAVPSGFVVEPNGYTIVSFHTRVFDEKGDSIVLLTRDAVEVDRTPTLTDEFDDDRTWQRFPNGIKTGNVSDWHFRDSTFGRSNGIPVARPNFTLSDPTFIDPQGNGMNSFLQGRVIGVRAEIMNAFQEERSFTYIIRVKNGEDHTVFIGWVEDLIILPNRTLTPSIFFLAETKGEYKVDVFVWRSLATPDPLTPTKTAMVRVAG